MINNIKGVAEWIEGHIPWFFDTRRSCLVIVIVAAFSLAFPTDPSLANEQAEQIADRIGPIWPKAADSFALAVSASIASRYNDEFGHSDELPDEDWRIVVDRLVAISERAHAKVVQAVRGQEPELRRVFVTELSKVPLDELSKLTAFLESNAGSDWLLANSQFEQHMFGVLVRAGAYTIASRRRAQALNSLQAESKKSFWSYGEPILMLSVMEGGVRSTPSVYFISAYLSVLPAIDSSVSVAYASADQALSNGRKKGFSPQTLIILPAVLGVALRDGLRGFDIQRVLGKPMIDDIENQVRDLGRRARLAADPLKTGMCDLHHGRLDPASVRASGGDLSKVHATRQRPNREYEAVSDSIKPGSLEHIWLAEYYEHGCYVEKDFAIAFRLWMELAELGNVKVYCKVANWQRYGIGTKANAEVAEKWEAKYREQAFGKSCPPLDIDPRNPWAEITRSQIGVKAQQY